MKKRITSLFLAACLFGGSLMAIGPMKDIELDPEKKTDEGYWLSVDTQGGHITFQYNMDAFATLRVFDLQGREMDQASVGQIREGRDYQCDQDFSSFAPGIYFAQLSSNGGVTVTTKFVVSR